MISKSLWHLFKWRMHAYREINTLMDFKLTITHQEGNSGIIVSREKIVD